MTETSLTTYEQHSPASNLRRGSTTSLVCRLIIHSMVLCSIALFPSISFANEGDPEATHDSTASSVDGAEAPAAAEATTAEQEGHATPAVTSPKEPAGIWGAIAICFFAVLVIIAFKSTQNIYCGLAIGGTITLALGGLAALILGDSTVLGDALAMRIWSNLLLVAYFLVTIALGGALFVALTYIAGGKWQVAFRRIPETLAKMLPIAGTAMLVVLVLRLNGYGWADEHAGPTFWFKEMWLTPAFWIARSVGYVVLWSLLANRLVARSRSQDISGDPDMLTGNVRLSAVFLAVYATTFTLASIDWIMALHPMWFSTMWGVYQFAGMMQATLAVMIIMGLVLRAPGRPLNGIFNDEHLHDLGQLLIGFSCFWMYIWFSQYMLIWYSNIPEETAYYIDRTNGPWGPIVVGAVIINWIVPFFVLLPKPSKRNATVMMRIACVVLVGRWIDLYVTIFPSSLTHPSPTVDHLAVANSPVFGVWEVAAISCLIGFGTMLVIRCFDAKNAVPVNDPCLNESLHYHA